MRGKSLTDQERQFVYHLRQEGMSYSAIKAEFLKQRNRKLSNSAITRSIKKLSSGASPVCSETSSNLSCSSKSSFVQVVSHLAPDTEHSGGSNFRLKSQEPGEVSVFTCYGVVKFRSRDPIEAAAKLLLKLGGNRGI